MRRSPRNKLMTLEDEKVILESYREGLSASRILRERLDNKFKTTKTIYDILRKYEVDTRGMKECKDPNLDHYYFSSIDSPSKAYLLGLMIADGWVTKPQLSKGGMVVKSPQIALSLGEEDSYLVEWAKEQWKSKNIINKIPPKNTHHHVMHRIIITSNQMYSDLNKLGIDVNKSYVSILPSISNSLYSHLFRGILDGDGSVGVYNHGSRRNYLNISYYGTLSLLGQMSWYLHKELGLTYVKPIKSRESDVASIKYSVDEEVNALIEFLYRDKESAVYMLRKWKKIEDYIS